MSLFRDAYMSALNHPSHFFPQSVPALQNGYIKSGKANIWRQMVWAKFQGFILWLWMWRVVCNFPLLLAHN